MAKAVRGRMEDVMRLTDVSPFQIYQWANVCRSKSDASFYPTKKAALACADRDGGVFYHGAPVETMLLRITQVKKIGD